MTQPEDTEAQKVREHVNRSPNEASEEDEELILEGLYGPVDADGFYRGTGIE